MDFSTAFHRQCLDRRDRPLFLLSRIFPLHIGVFVDQMDKGQPENLGAARPVTHRAPSLNSTNVSGTTYLVPDTIDDTGDMVRINQIQICALMELIFHWGNRLQTSHSCYIIITKEKKIKQERGI